MSAKNSTPQPPPDRARTTRDAPQSVVLHVCTFCRPSGVPREPQENRPGFQFYHQLREVFSEGPLSERVEVRPADCLSLCPRPCAIALSSPGAWTYLFGDQQPIENARDVEACVSLYLESVDGFMPRAERPKSLRASILGRVPPRDPG